MYQLTDGKVISVGAGRKCVAAANRRGLCHRPAFARLQTRGRIQRHALHVHPHGPRTRMSAAGPTQATAASSTVRRRSVNGNNSRQDKRSDLTVTYKYLFMWDTTEPV